MNTIPPGVGSVADAQAAFFGATGRLYRRVDIHNADGTIWYSDAPVIEGQVSVDYTRDERRTLDLTLDNVGYFFRSDPAGFWYDKIIKIYRGVTDSAGNTLSYPIGEFMIDKIVSPSFPTTTKVSGRDYTKALKQSTFSAATGFTAGTTLESAINGIAGTAGITKRNVPVTGNTLDRDFYFEAGSARWDALKALADGYNKELFFDAAGVMTLRDFIDPTTAPVTFEFDTGPDGNLARYELATNDTRIYNHILVKGTANDQLPVAGSAENNEPSSPTRIARIGRRTLVFESKFISDVPSATARAISLLKVNALESYELAVDSLVAPWLEVGVAVRFTDPHPAVLAPSRFLLTDFTIPLAGGTMSANAKRVTIVY